MSEKPELAVESASSHKAADEIPTSIFLKAYPKVIFLYPTFLASLLAAIYLSFFSHPFEENHPSVSAVSVMFLCVLAVNLVILGFDFPRTTSLTLFFFAAAAVMGFILLCTFEPSFLPWVTHVLKAFHPLASASFYWGFAVILGVILAMVQIATRFDYWEVRPNELLHHHGFLSNLERLSAPNLRIDKEINDVFEYFLLRSGRLILQASNERRAIILDNVPFIAKKEEAITRMLGALQVQVRPAEGSGQ